MDAQINVCSHFVSLVASALTRPSHNWYPTMANVNGPHKYNSIFFLRQVRRRESRLRVATLARRSWRKIKVNTQTAILKIVHHLDVSVSCLFASSYASDHHQVWPIGLRQVPAIGQVGQDIAEVKQWAHAPHTHTPSNPPPTSTQAEHVLHRACCIDDFCSLAIGTANKQSSKAKPTQRKRQKQTYKKNRTQKIAFSS